MKCMICNKDFKSLTNHLKYHKISQKEYYDKYLIQNENEKICIMYTKNSSCKKYSKFLNIQNGYSKYCSSCLISIAVEKRKRTMLEKYGVENISQLKKIKEKRKNTFLEKYGVENASQIEEVKKKKIQTSQLHYDTDYPLQNKEIIEKIKKTNIEKYGCECSLQNEKIKKKVIQTNIEKTGFKHQMKSEQSKKKLKNTISKKRDPIIREILLKNLDLELLTPYQNNVNEIKVRCNKCGQIYLTNYFNLYQCPHPCISCYPRSSGFSKQEKEILSFIENILPNEKIFQNYRNLKNRSTNTPFELDIFIPTKKIAIEYNGLYWHSEKYKPKNYHLEKLEECEKNNIRCIQIFEDEWLFKQDIVKARLKHILNQTKELEKLYAKDCIIREIIPKEKDEFLKKYHIQGSDKSIVKLGAFYDNELVSVMTFSHGNISKGSKSKKDVWELNRFCTNYNFIIVGIAGKLLNYFKRNYQWKEIFSYADRRWSDGNLYRKLSFSLFSTTKPNYWYIKGFQRIHRFNLRKQKNEGNNISEWVLRQKEGYERVWDCGSLKYILKNKEI